MVSDHEKVSKSIAPPKQKIPPNSIALKYEDSKLRRRFLNNRADHFCLISTDRSLGKRADKFGKSLNRQVRTKTLNTMTLRSIKR